MAAWYALKDPDPVVPAGDSGELQMTTLRADGGGSPFEVAISATTDAGVATLETVLNVRMPQGLDDGIPKRKIEGSGTMNAAHSVASMEFDLADVPNAAGFLGQVDEPFYVSYSGERMLMTSPDLVGVFPDGADWLSYDLRFLSTRAAISHGIGQMRELALSDPRLGVALLRGVTDPAEPIGKGDAGGRTVVEYAVTAYTEAASEAAPELALLLDEIAVGLQMRQIPVTVSIDEDGVIRKLDYALVFPAGKGPGKIRLRVETELAGFGAEPAPEAPDEAVVADYEDFLKKFFPDD